MDAIQVVDGDDQRGAAMVRAGRMTETEAAGDGVPSLVLVLACANSAALSLDQARRAGGALPPGMRLVRVPCAGRVDPQLVLDALVQGYDGVAILDCHPGACHSLEGNTWAGLRLENLRRLLAEAGLEPERVTLRHLSPVAAGQALGLLREVQAGLAELGPNPVRVEAQVRAMLERFTLRMDESYRLI
jgi:coenzyme F420-reducing hydrogenase delta subunit